MATKEKIWVFKNGREIHAVEIDEPHTVYHSASTDFIAWPDDDEDDDDMPDTIRDDDDDEDDEDDDFGGPAPNAVYFDEAVALGARPSGGIAYYGVASFGIRHESVAFNSEAYDHALVQKCVKAEQDRLDNECARVLGGAFDKAFDTIVQPLIDKAAEMLETADLGGGVGANCHKCSGWVAVGNVCAACPPPGATTCPVTHRKGADCPVCNGKGWVRD